MSREQSAFEVYLRTGRRVPEQIETKFNPYHDPSKGQFTFAPGGAGRSIAGLRSSPLRSEGVSSRSNPISRSTARRGAVPTAVAQSGVPLRESSWPGVRRKYDMAVRRLPPETHAFVSKVATSFSLATGKRLTVTSATRSPLAQAAAMLRNGRAGWGRLYANRIALAEIERAYARGKAAGERDPDIARRMAKVITRQVSEGRYISNHLKARAVDLRTRDLRKAEIVRLKAASEKHGAKNILDEGDHLHVQF